MIALVVLLVSALAGGLAATPITRFTTTHTRYTHSRTQR